MNSSPVVGRSAPADPPFHRALAWTAAAHLVLLALVLMWPQRAPTPRSQPLMIELLPSRAVGTRPAARPPAPPPQPPTPTRPTPRTAAPPPPVPKPAPPKQKPAPPVPRPTPAPAKPTASPAEASQATAAAPTPSRPKPPPAAARTPKPPVEVDLTPVRRSTAAAPAAPPAADELRAPSPARPEPNAPASPNTTELAARLKARLNESGQPAGSPASPSQPDPLPAFFGWVRDLYFDAWSQPTDPATLGLAAEAQVRVSRSGRVLGYELIASSGDAAFDASVREALAAVRELQRPVPDAWQSGAAEVTIPITFER